MCLKLFYEYNNILDARSHTNSLLSHKTHNISIVKKAEENYFLLWLTYKGSFIWLQCPRSNCFTLRYFISSFYCNVGTEPWKYNSRLFSQVRKRHGSCNFAWWSLGDRRRIGEWFRVVRYARQAIRFYGPRVSEACRFLDRDITNIGCR